MEVPDRPAPPAASPRHPARLRFQFSLQTLLIAMSGFAVLLSAVFAGPSWLAGLTAIVLAILVPMCLTIGLIYGRDYLRTFSIGAMFPAGMVLIWISGTVLPLGFSLVLAPGNFVVLADQLGNMEIGVGIVVGAVVILAFGFTAVLLRWLIEQNARPAEDDTPY